MRISILTALRMQMLLAAFMLVALLLLGSLLGWQCMLLATDTTSYERYKRRQAIKQGIRYECS